MLGEEAPPRAHDTLPPGGGLNPGPVKQHYTDCLFTNAVRPFAVPADAVSADCARLVCYTILVIVLEREVFAFVCYVAADPDIWIPIHGFQVTLHCRRGRGVLLDPLYQMIAGDREVHEITASDGRLEAGMLGMQLSEHVARSFQPCSQRHSSRLTPELSCGRVK